MAETDSIIVGEHDDYIPLRDVVFKKLRENIITGVLKPGDRLMEIKLANEMGVSRTPVREAIRKLQNEGLVITNAGRGAIVAPINSQSLQELLEIRKALEALACRLVCHRGMSEDFKKLDRINNNMKKAVEENDIKHITEYDVLFHNEIVAISGNVRLNVMLSQIKEHLFRYRLAFIKATDNREQLVEEHNLILNAMMERNPDKAASETEKHIERQEIFILTSLRE